MLYVYSFLMIKDRLICKNVGTKSFLTKPVSRKGAKWRKGAVSFLTKAQRTQRMFHAKQQRRAKAQLLFFSLARAASRVPPYILSLPFIPSQTVYVLVCHLYL